MKNPTDNRMNVSKSINCMYHLHTSLLSSTLDVYANLNYCILLKYVALFLIFNLKTGVKLTYIYGH